MTEHTTRAVARHCRKCGNLCSPKSGPCVRVCACVPPDYVDRCGTLEESHVVCCCLHLCCCTPDRIMFPHCCPYVRHACICRTPSPLLHTLYPSLRHVLIPDIYDIEGFPSPAPPSDVEVEDEAKAPKPKATKRKTATRAVSVDEAL